MPHERAVLTNSTVAWFQRVREGYLWFVASLNSLRSPPTAGVSNCVEESVLTILNPAQVLPKS
jgi:hypothetical protein